MRAGAALILAGFAAASTTSCGEGQRQVLSIDDVVARIDVLNGQTVRVEGFLKECGGYDCHLYKNETDARRAGEWMAAATRARRSPGYELPESLGIGSDDHFDAKAAPFVGRYVVITGKVDNRCLYQGKRSCLDRSPDIHPTAIEPWRTPGGATGPLEKQS